MQEGEGEDKEKGKEEAKNYYYLDVKLTSYQLTSYHETAGAQEFETDLAIQKTPFQK